MKDKKTPTNIQGACNLSVEQKK